MSLSLWIGERVRLRGIEPSDWEVFFAWDQDDQSARETYQISFPRSREGTQRWVERVAVEAPEEDSYRWGIVNTAETLVGTINTFGCDRRHGSFSYGLAVAREHRRKGYASEAIRLVLRYHFEELRYHKATVRVYSFNEPSIHLHQRLGFQQEGRLRETIYTQNQFFDEIMFGITSPEYAQQKEQASPSAGNRNPGAS